MNHNSANAIPIVSKTDIPFTVLNLFSTAAAITLPFFYYSKSAITAFFIFYAITGLGLTLGYHRLFAHHSFSVPLWLEHIIAICGYLAIQRGPIFWVCMHRLHHKHTEIPGKDPHTPKEGIWHVHFGWNQKRRNDVWEKSIYRDLAPDLVNDKLYLWMDKESNDYITNFSLIAISFVVGGFIGGIYSFDIYNAICFVVWVGLLNRVALLHAFGLINSVCHLIGTRPFKPTGADSSVNNFLVALIIFGEGWHNNHHTFPSSARQGLRWYQIDIAWYVIWLMEKIGLAKDVKLPRERSITKRLVKNQKQALP